MLNMTGYANKDLRAQGVKDPAYNTRSNIRELSDRFAYSDEGLKTLSINLADLCGMMDSILISSQPCFLSVYLERELKKRGKKVNYAVYDRKLRVKKDGTTVPYFEFKEIIPALPDED